MEKASVHDLDPAPSAGDGERRELTDPLGTTDVAINRYRLAPGERISGLHGHGDQEEVFVVVEGEATFETFVPGSGETASEGGNDAANEGGQVETAIEGGEVVVGAGEAIRFAPGEYQSGKNDSEGEAVVYALGAPRDTEDVRIPLACPDCGHGYLRPTLAADGETPVLACPDCGAETAGECSNCGSEDVYARLAADGETPVSACRDCGFESETP